jgi:hypothetical protein
LFLYDDTRYQCVGKKKTHHFNGYDEAIINQLPEHLQKEFLAVLSHKSRISKRLANLQRILMQNSVGSSKMHRILRELHTLKFDHLHHQYLSAHIHEKQNPTLSGMTGVIKEFSMFDDPRGYTSHVPSSNYLKLGQLYSHLLFKKKP